MMKELKEKIDNLIRAKSRQIPKRNTLSGLLENMKKKTQLMPRLEKDLNLILQEYQKKHTLTDIEKEQLKKIVKDGITKFMAY